MLRIVAAVAVLLLLGCSSSPAQCKPCGGSYYNLSGPPDHARVLSVVECVAALPCVTRTDLGSSPMASSQSLHLPGGLDQETLDGEPIQVTLTTRNATWQGSSTLSWRASEGECSCSGLSASVELVETPVL